MVTFVSCELSFVSRLRHTGYFIDYYDGKKKENYSNPVLLFPLKCPP